jgi:hypothetical protein
VNTTLNGADGVPVTETESGELVVVEPFGGETVTEPSSAETDQWSVLPGSPVFVTISMSLTLPQMNDPEAGETDNVGCGTGVGVTGVGVGVTGVAVGVAVLVGVAVGMGVGVRVGIGGRGVGVGVFGPVVTVGVFSSVVAVATIEL